MIFHRQPAVQGQRLCGDFGGHVRVAIAVAADDTPKITYFDRDTGSLKYAAKVGGVWQSHIVDGGTGEIDLEFPSETAGLYSSLPRFS